MATTRILIVDDELIIRESLGGWLERDGYSVSKAASGEEALDMIRKIYFDILLVDIKMGGMSGIELLKRVKENDSDAAVIMITAYGSISTSIEAMKLGAADYLLKPFDPGELGVLIEKILNENAKTNENLYLRDQHRERTRFENMIGQSPKMQEIFSLIEDIAPIDSTVLISGETGTGKGLAAKAIHTKSPRCDGPFMGINCGAIPEHLMESELFGYQKGAFTDAKENKKGKLELANGGTLFLDEIGEISMRMQIDLLRVVEDRILYRIGGTQPIETDFRIIAATNKNIEEAVKTGQFREDLYYRLNVISFVMPPLRDRKEDIPLLTEQFLFRFSREMNRTINGIEREAMDELMLYEWPGNIRELENAVERAVVVCKENRIQSKDLPIFKPQQQDYPLAGTLKEVEQTHIQEILEKNDWNISKAARVLGIDRSTLYKKIKLYKLSNRP